MKRNVWNSFMLAGSIAMVAQATALAETETVAVFDINHFIDSPQCIFGSSCTYKYQNDEGFAEAIQVKVNAVSHRVKVEEKFKLKCSDGSKVTVEFKDDRFVVDEDTVWVSDWYGCPEGAKIVSAKVKVGTTELIPDRTESTVELIAR